MRITEVESEAPKYREAFSDRLGRYLVAGKKLSPGEVILREKPIVVGPAVFNANSLCTGCLRIIPSLPIMNLRFSCSSCKVATFCSASCEERRAHHSPEECEAFKISEGLKTLSFSEFRAILLPLRLWLLRRRNAELWGTVLRLEDHLEDRRNTPVWRQRQETVVDVLKKLQLISQDDDELIQRICGILDVNSFELRSPGSLDNSPLRGLYCQVALMAHDCRGNTLLTVDDDFTLTVFASVPIEEGDAILVNYAPSLLGTLERREFLQVGKYFRCNCQLCLDPNELGAHLSSILCPRCRRGFLQLDDCGVATPFVKEKVWRCPECDRSYSGRLVKSALDLAQAAISRVQDDAKEMEKLIKNLTRTFHPNHTLIVNLKQKLLAVYRNEVATVNPPKKLLQRILELCRDVLQVLEVVEPGISRLKGITLYEMHLPVVFLANRAHAAREISTKDLANHLEEALGLLKRALSMLLLEPATTPEGLLAKRALQEYKILREKLDDVKSLPAEPKPCKKSNKKSN